MKIGRQGNRSPAKFRREKTTSQKVAAIVRTVILVALVVGFIWAQNNFVTTKNYIYTDKRVPKTFVGYNIVHISDIHNNTLNSINAVKKCDPDLIVVTGGLTDDEGDCDKSIKALKKLSDIATTVFVLGENDKDSTNEILSGVGDGPIFIEGDYIDIPAPEVNTDKFLDKYIGNKILREAEQGDQDSIDYVTYTKEKLAADANAIIKVSGLNREVENLALLDIVYSIIGTNKETFQVIAFSPAKRYAELSLADIDIVLSGETHGNKDASTGISKGNYAENGTTFFVSGGVSHLAEHGSRMLNLPEISCITLSDGTIKDENPLERVLSYFIGDVGTRFDNDGGFQEYKYTYKEGRQEY